MVTRTNNTPVSGRYFADFGENVLENGYNIVPIAPGQKRPYPEIVGWQNIEATKATLRNWNASGYGQGGIGINTRDTPAVDIDVRDEKVVAALIEWIHAEFGMAPVRVGQRPKSLLLFKSSEPFRKMMSRKFEDCMGDHHRVEILGEGQQFVAFSIHPETKTPYRWTTEDSPLTINRSDLPKLTADGARRIIAKFEELAEQEDWESVARGSLNSSDGDHDMDDPFLADAQKVTIDDGELQRLLMLIEGSEDYDTWREIGMALYHQYDGDYQGLDMWKEWSSTADNYDARECDKKWKSFDIREKGRAPITAKIIIKRGKEASEELSTTSLADFKERFEWASTTAEWDEITKEVKASKIEAFARVALAVVAKKEYKRISNGVDVPIGDVRKRLEFDVSLEDRPKWLEDWVYDTSAERCFFNIKTKTALTRDGFNFVHMRKALSEKDRQEGKMLPSMFPADIASTVHKIPDVSATVYYPPGGELFTFKGEQAANLYRDDLIPDVPTNFGKRDKEYIRRVKGHVAHLLKDEREQGLLLSYLAYCVQNPGMKINYAVLLQGVEGDGKSFFYHLLSAVMGSTNVNLLNASSLKSDFNGWSVGQCVMAVEEVRLQGESRYDVLNKIKPLITNSEIEVHAKGKTQAKFPNTTNYLLFTNFQDAMPIEKNDRRYLVLHSRWQDAEELRAFKEENPRYYYDLYDAVFQGAGALRKWLLEFEMHEDFDPMSEAPLTTAKELMIKLALPEDIKHIKELIEDGEYPDISDELLNITKLSSPVFESQIELPTKRSLSHLMARGGWKPLDGRVVLDGVKCRFYSAHPEKFTDNGDPNGKIDASKVRAFIQSRTRPPAPDPMDDEL